MSGESSEPTARMLRYVTPQTPRRHLVLPSWGRMPTVPFSGGHITNPNNYVLKGKSPFKITIDLCIVNKSYKKYGWPIWWPLPFQGDIHFHVRGGKRGHYIKLNPNNGTFFWRKIPKRLYHGVALSLIPFNDYWLNPENEIVKVAC